jgi:hypothetical protein
MEGLPTRPEMASEFEAVFASRLAKRPAQSLKI